MKKYKFKGDLLIIIVLSIAICVVMVCISIVYLVDGKNENNLLSLKPSVASSLNVDNYQDYFKFKGSELSSNLIDKRYLSLLYKNDDKLDSHLIDLRLGKEISVKDLIKKNSYDSFNQKINDLLKLKYPSKVIDKLNKTSQAYYFDTNILHIYYNTIGIIDSQRDFSLKVDYNEIKDFLTFIPILNKTYINENGYDYDPQKITVAFTFDDGPSGDKTLRLIEALEDYKMSATFFMVGYKLENHASVVRKVYDSHSEAGYHSYSHTRFTSQSKEQIISDYNLSNQIFNKITGAQFKLTRPPYGNYNSEVLETIDNAFIRWNIDTNDWQYKDVDYIVNYVMDNLKNHAIILFHDSYDTSVTAAIKLMEKLYYQDVQVLSVTKLAKLLNYPLENHQVYFSFD